MMTYPNLRTLLEKYNLVLASGSPRRVGILKDNGVLFRQAIPDIDENNDSDLPPVELAVSLAEKKARAVGTRLSDSDVALGCDTIVILRGMILGKPESPAHAIEMLSSLSGNMHTVCSAIALLKKNGVKVSGYELTDVFFREVSEKQIKEYVASGEPMDKAGAYGIQELGGFLVDRIEGNIDNVIGLPMTLLDKLAGRII
jgi:septum formation protein